jgi:hypothetical protein
VSYDICPLVGQESQPLISLPTETFRARALALVHKAYTSITLTMAQPYLGLSPEETVAALTLHGWTYDSASQILLRGAAAPTSRPKGGKCISSRVLYGDF